VAPEALVVLVASSSVLAALASSLAVLVPSTPRVPLRVDLPLAVRVEHVPDLALVLVVLVARVLVDSVVLVPVVRADQLRRRMPVVRSARLRVAVVVASSSIPRRRKAR